MKRILVKSLIVTTFCTVYLSAHALPGDELTQNVITLEPFTQGAVAESIDETACGANDGDWDPMTNACTAETQEPTVEDLVEQEPTIADQDKFVSSAAAESIDETACDANDGDWDPATSSCKSSE